MAVRDEPPREAPVATPSTLTDTSEAAEPAGVVEPPRATPSSMQEWEALWSVERAAVIKKISDGGYGISPDGQSALISQDYTVDLSTCPPGWNNTEGLTPSEIKLGFTAPLSGVLRAIGDAVKGWQLYLDQVNGRGIPDATGEIRRFTATVYDDGYDPVRTSAAVRELITTDKVFSLQTAGSPGSMGTRDTVQQQCIPRWSVLSGHPAWGDPLNHPWTTGDTLAYHSEAQLWGAFIEARADELRGADGKITVAAVVMNNDIGNGYDAGFRAWLAQTPIRPDVEYVTERFEPARPGIPVPGETLVNTNPDVFFAMTAGASCSELVVTAPHLGLQVAKALFVPSVCKSNNFMGKDRVGGDGSLAEGWWVVGGGTKAMDSLAFDADPWVAHIRGLLEDREVDWRANPQYLTGAGRLGWITEQVFRIASALEGGLSRVNLIVAWRNLDLTAPFLVEGVSFALDGRHDAYLVEGSEFATYNAAEQTFQHHGDVIDLSGRSPNCAWSQSEVRCD